MVSPSQQQDHSDITLSYLEGVGDDWVSSQTSLDGISVSKGEHKVDLSDLEQINVAAPPEVMNNQEPSSETENTGRRLWEEMDVSLDDMVTKIFASSNRPIAIVRDDKIEYLNPTALKMLEVMNLKVVQDEPFLKFVDKEDWNLLAENIGAMMTEGQKLPVRMRSAKGKIINTALEAVYLSDNRHFSFILIGSHIATAAQAVKASSLYDDVTALPNFYLFEDRVQMAVNAENYKDVRLAKNMIAVAAISIDNIETFKRLDMENFALKKLASSLVVNLKKQYTVARGLKYQFWLLIDDVSSEQSLDVTIRKAKAILDDGVADNFTIHDVRSSIGISIFPQPAHSAKKLIEQAISAVQEASQNGGNKVVYFNRY